MPDISRIKEHMTVMASDGRHIGTVDCVKDDMIILAKSDPASGGAHRGIPLKWVTVIDEEENKIRLDQTSEQARNNWFKDPVSDDRSRSKTACP